MTIYITVLAVELNGGQDFMKMNKPKLIKRRALSRCDFRGRYKRILGIILVEGDGHIDVTKIEKAFPDIKERNNYYNALIKAMEQ